MQYTCQGQFCDFFDPFTLNFFMSESQASGYGRGSFPMTITGKSGDKTVSHEFVVAFASPCEAINTIEPYDPLED